MIWVLFKIILVHHYGIVIAVPVACITQCLLYFLLIRRLSLAVLGHMPGTAQGYNKTGRAGTENRYTMVSSMVMVRSGM